MRRHGRDDEVLGGPVGMSRGGLLVLIVSVAVVAIGLRASAAVALSQRGHVFADSFTAGAAEGGLSLPQGIAVDEGNGDVYVVDAGDNRVDRFDSAHELVEAWGWGVADGKKEFERCTSSCRAGLAGPGQFELSGARSIAVDNSTAGEDPSRGDVYVETISAEGVGAIDKFGPEGQPLERIGHVHGEVLEEPHGIAVDPSGALWVYYEEAVVPFSDGEPNKACPSFKHAAVPSCPGVATLEPVLSSEGRSGNSPLYGLALDADGDVYVGHEGDGGGEPFDAIAKQLLVRPEGSEPELLSALEELDHETATGLAADESSDPSDPSAGDVYVDNGDGVAVFDGSGALVQRLTADGSLQDATGVAVDSSRGLVYVAEAGAQRIDMFALEGEGPPTIASLATQDVSGVSGQLDAQVDPDGAATSYAFRLSPGAVPRAGQACNAPCQQLEGATELAPGYGEDGASVVAGDLAPATKYHFRVIATNVVAGREQVVTSSEATFTTQSASEEQTADGRDWELVSTGSGGEAEAQTEAGGVIQAAAGGQAITYVAGAAAGEAEGSRSIEVTQMLATRGPDGWVPQDIVTPNERANGLKIGAAPEYRFFSSNLALALVEPFDDSSDGSPLAEPPLSPALDGEAGEQEKTVYLRDDQPIDPTPGRGGWSEEGIYEQARENGKALQPPGYVALLTKADTEPGASFGASGDLEFLGATPDLTSVVLRSKTPLTEGAKEGSLYEWREGKPILVSVLPGPAREQPLAPTLGLADQVVRNAISSNGSRVFWGAEKHLYMTDVTTGESIQLDEVQGGSGANNAEPNFQTASADGSRVFFTDQQRLTPGSGAEPGRPDLYVCEVQEGEGGPSCILTDLTPGAGGEPAAVQGMVPGASEDGSIVYFVANGALAAGARPGQCRPQPQPGSGCNLYVDRFDGSGQGAHWAIQLVTRLSGEDGPDWYPQFRGLAGPTSLTDFGGLTSRVSPDGNYLAFMSEESEAISGYDNRDVDPEAHEALDEEAFLYDATTGRTVCVSCDPSGARPHGVLDPGGEGESTEGIGLLVDRARGWAGRWLAAILPGWTKLDQNHALYQPRYLSDSGRLFFDSPADLVSQATNGKNDVYEYEPLGVPHGPHACSSRAGAFIGAAEGCLGLISSGTSSHESAFLDASESGGEGESGQTLQEGGGDVFFVSAAKLQPQDASSGFVVYDAHECTTALPCPPPPEAGLGECDSTTECGRSASAATPVGIDVQTGLAVGDGNIVPAQGTKPFSKSKPTTNAQKLATALRECRRAHRQRKRRQACEAKARRKYGKQRARSSADTHAAGRKR